MFKWIKWILIPLILLGLPVVAISFGLGLERVFNPVGEKRFVLGISLILILLGSCYPVFKGWQPWGQRGSVSKSSWQQSPVRRVIKRFFRHKIALLGLLVLTLFAVMALFPQWFLQELPDYNELNAIERREVSQSPSRLHPLGLTRALEDIWTKVVLGARPVFSFAIRATFVAVIMGGLVGSLSGYLGGIVDRVIMMVTEMILAFPSLFIIMTVLAVTHDPEHRLWLIAAFGVASTAKLVRAEVLALRENEYVLAAKAVGGSEFQILFKHILSNALPLLVVQATLFAGQAVMMDAAISFLGLATQGWAGEIGIIVRRYRALAIYHEPYLMNSAGACILAMVLSFNLLGDALRDALEVKI